MEDFELLATLQHYGDQTNLIDFTTDYLVALFFACDGEPAKPGRVILLQRHSESASEPYGVEKPPRTIRRAEAQKSIFVEAPKGFVEPDKVVCIPANLKPALLRYLRKHHNIFNKTIYNDLHGHIETRRLHEDAYTAFNKGLTSQEHGYAAKTNTESHKLYEEAIAYYTEAIELKPDLSQAYSQRSFAYHCIDDFEKSIQDHNIVIALEPENANGYIQCGFTYLRKGYFEKTIEDYSKAIELGSKKAGVYKNRGFAYHKIGDFAAAIEDYSKSIELVPLSETYCNRGETRLHLKEWQKAKADLTTAKDMGCDIIASFHKDYESVEDFEKRNEVKMPKDIAALLQRK